MIKNVIFDLGDVLINNNPLQYIKTLGYSDEKTNALYQALSTDSVWHDKDIGIYESYVDCIPIFQKHHPELVKEIADFFQDSWMEKVYTPIEENMVLYNRAKELGYDIFFLTNYSVDGFAYLEENYDFIRNVKGKIVSSHVHCCKPERKSYKRYPMSDKIFAKCGNRCDLCLIYRPNVEENDRREEICKVYSKIWHGFEPNPQEIICDGCSSIKDDIVLFSPDCETRKCVIERNLEHCGHCDNYPCDIFPAEPTQEVLVQKIDVEKQWTWEDEKLMEAYTCKKNMDEFREKQGIQNGK